MQSKRLSRVFSNTTIQKHLVLVSNNSPIRQTRKVKHTGLKITWSYIVYRASQVALVVKNPPANVGDIKRYGFYPWVRKIPWRRAWQSTPIFLFGESHRPRSLVGYSP